VLKYVCENRSSPRAVRGISLLKHSKLPTRLKNKNWTNPQIKNHTYSHELRLIRPHTCGSKWHGSALTTGDCRVLRSDVNPLQ
jgi:hypothetical protein